MKQMIRSGLSLALCFILAFSLFPLSALAETPTVSPDEPTPTVEPLETTPIQRPMEPDTSILISSVSIELPSDVTEVHVGDSLRLIATISPVDVSDDAILWSSSDLNIATIDASGQLKALSAGTIEITATALDGSDESGKLEISVLPATTEFAEETATPVLKECDDSSTICDSGAPTLIFVDYQSLDDDGTAHYEIECTVGDEAELEAKAESDGVLYYQWQIRDVDDVDPEKEYLDIDVAENPTACERKLIVTVDEAELDINDIYVCRLSAILEGAEVVERLAYFTFTERALDAKVATAASTGVTITATDNSNHLCIGDTLQLLLSGLDEQETGTVQQWSSSDESVVIVNDSGIVNGIDVGEAVIMVRVEKAGGETLEAEYTIVVDERAGANALTTSLASSHDPVTCDDVTEIVKAYLGIINNSGKKYWNASYTKDRNSELKALTDAGDYTTCLSSTPGTNNTNWFSGCTQCAGFVQYMIYVVFGTDPGNLHYDDKDMGWTKYKTVSDDFIIQPGDYIRKNGSSNGSHSIFIYKVKDDTVSYIQCNWDGKCGISVGEATTETARGWINANSKCYLRRSPAIEHQHVWQNNGRCSCGAYYNLGSTKDTSCAGFYKNTTVQTPIYSEPKEDHYELPGGYTSYKGRVYEVDYSVKAVRKSTSELWYHIKSGSFDDRWASDFYMPASQMKFAWKETLIDTTVYAFNQAGVAVRSEPFETSGSIAAQRGITIHKGDLVEVSNTVRNSYQNDWLKISSGELADLYVYAPNMTFSYVKTQLTIHDAVYPTGTIQMGEPFIISGTIESNYNLTSLSIELFEMETGEQFADRTVAVSGKSISVKEKLNPLVDFAALEPGYYGLMIRAKDEKSTMQDLVCAEFSVGLTSYEITYSSEPGCYGIPISQSKLHNVQITLSSVEPYLQYYNFVQWKDQNGTVYAPGAAYNGNADLALQAVWSPNLCLLVYSDINDDGEYDPDSFGRFNNDAGFITSSLELDVFTPSRRDYTFLGWSTERGGEVEYQPGDTIYCSCDTITLFPVWSLSLQEVGAGVVDGLNYHTSNGKEEIWNAITNDNLSQNEILIDNYTGNNEMLNIPQTINGMPVVSLRSYQYICRHENGVQCFDFPNCSVVPHGFSPVASFNNATVKEITIPASVEIISDQSGEGVFGQMQALERIVVTSDNPYFRSVEGVLYSKDGTRLIAYPRNKKDSSFVLPAEVTSIGAGTLKGSSFRFIALSPKMKTIEPFLFQFSSLEAVNIPDGVETIYQSAFANTNLTSVTIPASVSYLDYAVFSFCENLRQVTFLGSPPSKHFDEYAFSHCPDDMVIRFPSNLTWIWDPSNTGKWNGFDLVPIGDPDGVTQTFQISYRADGGTNTPSAEQVLDRQHAVISSIIPSRENYLFLGWASTADAVEAEYLPGQTNDFSMVEGNSCVLYAVWSEDCGLVWYLNTATNSIVISGCHNIQLKHLVIPDMIEGKPVTQIGSSAFQYCRNLESAQIGVNVQIIGDYAFICCSNLKKVSFLGSRPTFGEYVFYKVHEDLIICYPDEQVTSWQDTMPSFGHPIVSDSIGNTVIAISGEQLMIAGETEQLELTTTEGMPVASELITWSTNNSTFARIDATGKLITEDNISERKTIAIRASAPSISGTSALMSVDILPRTQFITLYDGETPINGERIKIGTMTDDNLYEFDGETLHGYSLFVQSSPNDAMFKYDIQSSNENAVFASYFEDTGELLLLARENGYSIVTVSAVDGSGEFAQVRVQAGDYAVTISNPKEQLGETLLLPAGKTLQLTGGFLPSNLTNTSIVWGLSAGDEAYASISTTGLLTAKALTHRQTITVIARAKDGAALQAEKQITIYPSMYAVQILYEGTDVTNKTIVLNSNSAEPLTFTSATIPLDAMPGVIWTLSSTSAATKYVSEEGVATITPVAGKSQLVTLTAKSNDGSGKSASVKIQVAALSNGLIISDDLGAKLNAGGKTQLNVAFYDPQPSNEKVTWYLAPEYEAYATLSTTGLLTAKAVTKAVTVQVVAIPADGGTESDPYVVTILPVPTAVSLLQDGVYVTNSTLTLDLRGTATLELDAKSWPDDADDSVIWKSSASTIVSVDETGKITGLKAGTATISATTAIGAKSASVKVTVTSLAQNIELYETDTVKPVYELRGGSGTSYRVIDSDTDQLLLASAVRWEMDSDFAPYATLSSSGTLTTYPVSTAKTITLRAEVIGNESAYVEFDVVIDPAAQSISLYNGSALQTKPITINSYEKTAADVTTDSVTLTAPISPDDSLQTVTWTSSNMNVAQVVDGVIKPVWNGSGYNKGTTIITAKAKDGSNVAASVQVVVAELVHEIELTTTSGKFEMTSGGSLQMKATVKETTATNKAVVYSIVDGAEYATLSGSGLLTAKQVYGDRTVTVQAVSADGGATDDQEITIHSKYDEPLTITNVDTGETISGETVSLSVAGTSAKTTLFNLSVPEAISTTKVKWSVAPSYVASVVISGEDTLLRYLATGTAVVTATATEKDGTVRTASFTLELYKPATSLTITPPKGVEEEGLTLASGKTMLFTGVIAPTTGVTTKGVNWSIDEGDADYATISSSGLLTAKAGLTEPVTIQVYAVTKNQPYREDTIEVALTPLSTGVDILSDEKVINNQTLTIDLTTPTLDLDPAVYPADKANQNVVWSSSNKTIAKVDSDGIITGLKAGTVTITAKAADGSGKSASIKVVVKTLVTGLEITSKTGFDMCGGKTLQLGITFTPTTPTDKRVTWSLSTADAQYATITSSGLLKANALTSKVSITVVATSVDNPDLTPATQVINIYPATTKVEILNSESETINDKTLVFDLNTPGAKTLTAQNQPNASTGALQSVTWKSSNTAVLTVSSEGVIEPVLNASTGLYRTGTVTITATATDGSKKSASVKVVVGYLVSGITFDSGLTVAAGKTLTIKPTFDPVNVTNKKLTWTIKASDAPYATISSTGVLTAKKVTEEKYITVYCTAQDGSGVVQEIPVTIIP